MGKFKFGSTKISSCGDLSQHIDPGTNKDLRKLTVGSRDSLSNSFFLPQLAEKKPSSIGADGIHLHLETDAEAEAEVARVKAGVEVQWFHNDLWWLKKLSVDQDLKTVSISSPDEDAKIDLEIPLWWVTGIYGKADEKSAQGFFDDASVPPHQEIEGDPGHVVLPVFRLKKKLSSII